MPREPHSTAAPGAAAAPTPAGAGPDVASTARRNAGTAPSAPASKAHQTPGRVAFVAAVLLVLLSLAWELHWAPFGKGSLVLKALPLALALPGLWAGRLYTQRWVSLLLWLYMAEALVRGPTEAAPVPLLALAEGLLALLLFAACAMAIRRRSHPHWPFKA